MIIKRRTEYFALTAIIPCLLIGAIELVTFMVPYDQTVRLELSFTCLLAYSMFQMMITSELPHSAEKPPLLLLLISLFTVYIGVAIAFQGVCIYIADVSHNDDERKPGQFLQNLAIRMAHVVAKSQIKKPQTSVAFKSQEVDGTIAVASDMPEQYKNRFFLSVAEQGKKYNQSNATLQEHDSMDEADWILIAKVIDKTGFIIFLCLLIGTTVALLVAIPFANDWGMKNM